MEFYHVKNSYIEFLKKYEQKILDNKNEKRPYIGVVLEIGNIKYYAPFSSPKPKHKKMKNGKDFRKINNGIYGAINFNNMIPIVDSALIKFDFNSVDDEKYKRLLQNQYKCIKNDFENIKNTAKKLRELLFADENSLTQYDKTIKQRCCDLPLLEKVYVTFKEI